MATGRIESARQIVGRVNSAKSREKEETDRARKEEEPIQEGGGRTRRWEAEGSGREDECRYVSFVVATKEPPGGSANRNRRPWSVYEFPQLATGDKQIASYFCIQRLNGGRVWNDAPARYKRPLLANTGGKRHARRIPNVIFARPSSSSSSLRLISVTSESDRKVLRKKKESRIVSSWRQIFPELSSVFFSCEATRVQRLLNSKS